MGWMLWWKRKRKWTPEEMKSIDEGRAELVVRYAEDTDHSPASPATAKLRRAGRLTWR